MVPISLMKFFSKSLQSSPDQILPCKPQHTRIRETYFRNRMSAKSTSICKFLNGKIFSWLQVWRYQHLLFTYTNSKFFSWFNIIALNVLKSPSKMYKQVQSLRLWQNKKWWISLKYGEVGKMQWTRLRYQQFHNKIMCTARLSIKFWDPFTSTLISNRLAVNTA
jgi:hypothetical protein